MGQPASAVHPRQRGGHVLGHPESTEGLPNFYLKDIPPATSDGAPAVTEPRILFRPEHQRLRDRQDQHAGVRLSWKGKDNVYANYTAGRARTAPPPGGSLFAWYFDDVNILLSRYITDQSRIMLHRNIQDRIRTIAPFLQLIYDPYIVVSDGRLY